jgi:hypothetical protein
MWSTTSTLESVGVSPEALWSLAYADPSAWPKWNEALVSAEPEGPFEIGARVRVRFRGGMRLRFTLVEVDQERVFTDESRLPGARMGHRHEIAPIEGGIRLTNTIYIEGPLARVWSLILGPAAKRGLADWQRKAVELARTGGE